MFCLLRRRKMNDLDSKHITSQIKLERNGLKTKRHH